MAKTLKDDMRSIQAEKIFHFHENNRSRLIQKGRPLRCRWLLRKDRTARSFDVVRQWSDRSLGMSFEFSSRRREACRPSCILPFLDSTCEEAAGSRACIHILKSREVH